MGVAGSTIGSIAGLAGAGLAFAEGDIRGGIQSSITGVGAAAQLGASIATNAAASATAAGASAAAASATAAASALSAVASAATGIGLVMAAGIIVENIVNAALGEGPYGKTKLPFGRSKNAELRFSSADNLASQKSKFASMQGANIMKGSIANAPLDPDFFLNLSGMGGGLSANGEVQFENKFGHGGDWDDPQSPEYTAALQRAKAGDVPTLRDLLTTTNIRVGESGATGVDKDLTEIYRTKFLYALPPDQRKQVMGGRSIDETIGMKLNPKNVESMYYRHRMLNPTKDGMIRFGGVKLPENHEYQMYTVEGDGQRGMPQYKDITPDQAVISLAPNATAQLGKGQTWGQNPTMIFDKTTGKMLSQQVGENSTDKVGNLSQKFQINPEYLDEKGLGTKAKAASAKVKAAQAAKKTRSRCVAP